MDANVKKTVLRMIPYGLYVLTAKRQGRHGGRGHRELGHPGVLRAASRGGGRQGRFASPIRSSRSRRPSPSTCSARIRARWRSPSSSRRPARARRSPASRFAGAPPARRSSSARPPSSSAGWWTASSAGDHSIFVGEVVEAGQAKAPEGRADDATLWLKDLGPNIFYGG